MNKFVTSAKEALTRLKEKRGSISRQQREMRLHGAEHASLQEEGKEIDEEIIKLERYIRDHG